MLRRMLTARGRSLEITKAGWLFITLTIAVGFAAINSGSNLLHILFGAQIALIIMSGILSEFVVQHAVVTMKVGSSLHANADGTVQVQVSNRNARYPLLALTVEMDDQQEHDGEFGAVVTFALEPGEVSTDSTRVQLRARGWQQLPPMVVATRFPFGLFVKRRFLPRSQPIIVYPALLDRSLDLNVMLTKDSLGNQAVQRVARSGDVYELREHRESDSITAINWPASARLDSLVVCEYEDRSQRSLILSLAPGRGGDPAFEHAVSLTSTAAIAGMRDRGMDIGLRYGEELIFPPSSGRLHEASMLRFLATVGMGDRG
ncbi:MAG: DUF58 domain-containing protein [Nannocystaceae bacterium]